jgi:hypothetical protein
MKKPSLTFTLLVMCALPTWSLAADLTGKVDVIAPILAGQNQVYVRLKETVGNAIPSGSPGGSCSNSFAFVNMSDANFKNFVYPLLLLAKASDEFITLRTSGCDGAFPIIIGVDYPPR